MEILKSIKGIFGFKETQLTDWFTFHPTLEAYAQRPEMPLPVVKLTLTNGETRKAIVGPMTVIGLNNSDYYCPLFYSGDRGGGSHVSEVDLSNLNQAKEVKVVGDITQLTFLGFQTADQFAKEVWPDYYVWKEGIHRDLARINNQVVKGSGFSL